MWMYLSSAPKATSQFVVWCGIMYRRRAWVERPFHDLRSVHKAGRPREQVKNHRRACTQILFLCKAELGFFHFLEIVTGWLVVPYAGRKIPVQRGLYLPPQKVSLAENRFLRQVREPKIQRTNPFSALRSVHKFLVTKKFSSTKDTS